jgi:Protein of unknown function (DUF1588)/Protein of unknown function (DUF1592)/Protein of unknown function (DUF1595)/Protein of unknown function (DUF1587)
MSARASSGRRYVTGLAAALGLALAAGCVGEIGGEASGGSPGSSGAVAPGSSGASGSSGAAGGSLLPSRVRLLSRVEYDNTVAALLGDTTHPAAAFPKDEPQNEYTSNAARVSGSLMTSLYVGAAETLAASARGNLGALVPCDPNAGTDACAQAFIASFAKKAFRRPVTGDDTAALFAVYQTAKTGGTFADGIESVLAAILMSPSFLYTTELGAGPPSGGTVQLSPYEVASALAYLVTASPPDDALFAAAAAGALGTAAAIKPHVVRLVATPAGRAQVGRFVSEWLESGKAMDKDPALFPTFASLGASVAAETQGFVADALASGNGTLSSMLTATSTVVDQPLADFYGLSVTIPAGTTQRVSLAGTGRMGLLMQASFLSTHGDTQVSSPIKRGVFLRRRLLCEPLPDPPPGVNVNPPIPDKTQTTRQQFDAHTTNPACAGCHVMINPIGNGFENFDAVGAHRTTDNGHPVDASGTIAGTKDADGAFKDASELVTKLAASQEVRACFARNVFRFASGQSSDATEQAFLGVLGADVTDSVVDLLVAYATSNLFTTRTVTP